MVYRVYLKKIGGTHMEITYTLVGDYYLPNLAAPERPKAGCWGMLRFNYLRKHWEALYTINTYAFVVPPRAYCTGRETLAGVLSPCRSRWTAVSAMSATGCTMVEQTYRPVAKSRMPS